MHSPSWLDSFPLDAMLLPLLVVFILSVKFFARRRSLAFCAAMAKAVALGPAVAAVEIEWNRLLKSVRTGSGIGRAIEWTVEEGPSPDNDADKNWVIWACCAADISIFWVDVVGGVWLLRWWDLERRFLKEFLRNWKPQKNNRQQTYLCLSIDLVGFLCFDDDPLIAYDGLCFGFSI